MLILIDGYNLIGPVAPPAGHRGYLGRHRGHTGRHRNHGGSDQHRWLEHARLKLIHEVASGIGPALAQQTWIIFDSKRLLSRFSAPEAEPLNMSVIQGITIEFSIGYDEADDRIEELIAAHHTPKRLTVVSSDHRLQVAARRRGALAVDGDVWLDRLSSGRPLLAVADPGTDRVGRDVGAETDPVEADSNRELQMDTTSWLKYFDVQPDSPAPSDAEEMPPKVVDNPFPPGYAEDLLDD